jgi:hypothetical protein
MWVAQNLMLFVFKKNFLKTFQIFAKPAIFSSCLEHLPRKNFCENKYFCKNVLENKYFCKNFGKKNIFEKAAKLSCHQNTFTNLVSFSQVII